MTSLWVDGASCLSHKHCMPKIATKSVADVLVRVGRQSFNVKVPLDLADLGADVSGDVSLLAKKRVDEGLKLSVVNLGAIKKAHKAYKRAQAQ